MGLLPEFFLLLGTAVFLVISLLCAFFDDDLPSRFQFVFQGAGGAGLGILLISEAGTFGQNPIDPTRIWMSTIYLAIAVASVAGLNVYVVVARRKIALATKFSVTVTAPIFMISAILAPYSLGTLTVGISMLVIGLSVFVFVRVKSNHTGQATGELESASPILGFPKTAANRTDLQSPLPSKPEWEESSPEEAQ